MPVFIASFSCVGKRGGVFSVLDRDTSKKQRIQKTDFSVTIWVGSGVYFRSRKGPQHHVSVEVSPRALLKANAGLRILRQQSSEKAVINYTFGDLQPAPMCRTIKLTRLSQR
jgi:hypothetical protein